MVAMIVGISLAVFTIFDPSEILKFESHITRIGSFPCSIRAFNIGSSAKTVPIPAMIAAYWCRNVCACLLASSPVIHLDSPVAVAIFPSNVIAYFNAVYGISF